MLHSKFQDHRTLGSGEEDFLKIFTIYGHGGHHGHVTKTIFINLNTLILGRFSFDWPSSFRAKDI